MLLTDIWELLEHFSEHPPMHRLMQYVAPTFGYKPPEQAANTSKPREMQEAARTNAGVDVAAMGGNLIEMPAHVRKSATMQRLIAEMKGGKADGIRAKV